MKILGLTLRKNMKFRTFVLLMLAVPCIIFFVWVQYVLVPKKLFGNVASTSQNVVNKFTAVKKTYDRKESDAVMEPKSGNKNIFFLETRCAVEQQNTEVKGLNLNPRQACTIESAARLNPEFTIHLLYTCKMRGNLSSSVDYVRELFTYSNIKIWMLDIPQFLKSTPLETWDFQANLKKSKWPVEHSSDVLRFVTLLKYGGLYLDLDVVSVRPISQLGTNFVIMESYSTLGCCAINFEPDGIGRLASELCVREILNNFNGQLWAYNGPSLVTRVMKNLCDTDELKEMKAEECKGVKALPHSYFTPIHWNSWQQLYKTSEVRNTLEELQESFGVHMWNSLSKQERLDVKTRTPYGLLARKFCPEVFKRVVDTF